MTFVHLACPNKTPCIGVIVIGFREEWNWENVYDCICVRTCYLFYSLFYSVYWLCLYNKQSGKYFILFLFVGGVFVLIMNYTGDVLNFGLAVETAKEEGYNVRYNRVFYINTDLCLKWTK